MKPGPAPKPTIIKKLAGNPGHKPLNNSEPQPKRPERVPYVPRHLEETAKEEWRRIIMVLLDIGLYTELDHTALVMYCQQFGRWIEAEKKIKDTGGEILKSTNGNLYQNPWFSVANKAYDQMYRIALEFGMTPSSRSRLNVKPAKDKQTLADILFDRIEVEDKDD